MAIKFILINLNITIFYMSLEHFSEFMDNIKVNMVQSGGDFNSFKENFSNSINKTMNSQNSQYSSDPNVSFSPMETSSFGAQPKKFTMWYLFKIVLGLTLFLILGFNIYTYLNTGSDAFTFYIGNFLSKGKNKIKNIFNKGDLKKSTDVDDIYGSLDLSAKNLANKEKGENSKLKQVVENGGSLESSIKGDKRDDSFFEDNKGENNDENDGNDEGDENDEGDGNDGNKKKLINEKAEKETDPEKKYGKNYAASSVLDLKLTKTPGYCYVGTDRNVRTCVNVKTGDKCASGKVFPTMDLCVNPNIKE